MNSVHGGSGAMPERDTSYDGLADLLLEAIEHSLKLNESAVKSMAALQQASGSFNSKTEEVKRAMNQLSLSLPEQAFSAVYTRFEGAAKEAADKITLKLDTANQAAERAAKTYTEAALAAKNSVETELLRVRRHWLTYVWIGAVFGAVISTSVTLLILHVAR